MDVRTMQIEAHQAYTQWLGSRPFDLFVTLTDPGLSHPEHMYKRTRYLMALMNRKLYGRNWKKRTDGIEHVIGLERQKRGSVHSHSLIRIPTLDVRDREQFPLTYWHKVVNSLGGHGKIELPKSQSDVVDYVTKYVCKEGEIYLSDNLNPMAPREYSHSLLGSAVH